VKSFSAAHKKAAPLVLLLIAATALSAFRGCNHNSLLGLAEWASFVFFVPIVVSYGLFLFLLGPLSEWQTNLAIPIVGVCVFGMFFILRPTLNGIGERREFAKIGLAPLRQESAFCVGKPEIIEEFRNHGGPLSSKTLPPRMSNLRRKFFPVDYYWGPEGIFMATDGWVNHKGGYFIVPDGSSYSPPHTRKVCDGIYRIEPRSILNLLCWREERRSR
jgi:hypothetical protein